MKNANSHKSFNPDRPALSPGEATALLYAPFDEQHKGKPPVPKKPPVAVRKTEPIGSTPEMTGPIGPKAEIAPTSPPVAVAPVIPPALPEPRLLQCGEPYDAINDYWEARQAVLAFLRSPDSFARGLLEEIRRQDLPVTGTLTDLENAVFRLRRSPL